MAFFLLSKLSHFKNAAFSRVPKSQVLSHLSSQNDANAMFPRWAANARAFCHKLDEVDGDGGMESNAAVMRGKSDETAGNAKDARSVLSLCKVERASDIILYPPEVLEDEGRLRELFEVWMDEFKLYYATKREKAKRFKDFKFNVFRISRQNRDFNCKGRLTRLSDHKPGTVLFPFPPRYVSKDGLVDGGMESKALVMKGKSDEIAGNAEDARSILSLCKVERVSDIILYPPEVLEDEGRLRELFEAWMDEFKIYFATKREKERRFKIFKFNVFRTQWLNEEMICNDRLSRFSADP